MKAAILLGIVQTAILVFLVIKVLALEDEIARQTAGTRTDARAGAAASRPDEELLKKIIREELAAQTTSQDSAAVDIRASAGRQPAKASIDQRAQRELVEKQLAYYRAQGAISQPEMQNLQGEIAKLDPEERKAMLSRLVKAMNAGEIRGAL